MANAEHPHRVTDADRQRVRDLHARGLGRNEIARQLGISAGTVSGIAKTLGLSFDRSDSQQLADARSSRSDDLRARRQRIQDKMLRQAEKLLDELDAGTWWTVLRGKQGSEHAAQLDFVPVRDRKDAVWAVGTYLANDERLERVTGDSGEESQRSMLTGLFRDIQGAWELAKAAEAAVDFDEAQAPTP